MRRDPIQLALEAPTSRGDPDRSRKGLRSFGRWVGAWAILILAIALASASGCTEKGNGTGPTEEGAPTATISAPTSGSAFLAGDTVRLSGDAVHPQGSSLPETALRWSSSVDGDLGSGRTLDVVLSPAEHWIRLVATDTRGRSARDSVQLKVEGFGARVYRAIRDEDRAAGFVLGQVLVRYPGGTRPSPDVLTEINNQYNIRDQLYLADIGWHVALLRADLQMTPEATAAVADALRGNSRVEEAALSWLLAPSDLPGDFVPGGQQHHLELTGLDVYWKRLPARQLAGDGIRVAIIDSGLDATFVKAGHDFSAPGKVSNPVRFLADTRVTGPAALVDPTGHGTLVASVAVGGGSDGNSVTGVAPGATVIPISWAGVDQDRLELLGQGVMWAINHGAHVINISLGYHFEAGQTYADVVADAKRVLGSPFDQALSQGIQIVKSSGNCYLRILRRCPVPSTTEVDPIAQVDERVWVVGATDKSGARRDWYSQTGSHLRLLAPGEEICGEAPEKACRSGTSFAAPIVTGLIAAYLSEGMSISQIEARLTTNTLPVEHEPSDRGRVIAGIHLESIRPETVPLNQPVTFDLVGRNIGRQPLVWLNDTQLANVTVLSSGSTGHLQFTHTFVEADAAKTFAVWMKNVQGGLVSDSVEITVTGAGGPRRPGDSFGDPHLRTMDGRFYSFMGVGDYILSKSTDVQDDFEVQIRYRPGGSTFSFNEAVAVRVVGDVVNIFPLASGTDLIINGVVTHVTGAFNRLLPGGGTVHVTGRTVTVTWPDRSQAEVREQGPRLAVRLYPAASREGRLEGLLGNFDGDSRNDVRVRNGPVIGTSRDELYGDFRSSWRVPLNSSGSLFARGPDYWDPSFPGTPQSIPGAVLEGARQSCRNAGVMDPDVLEACAFDVATTGDVAWADAAVAVDPMILRVTVSPALTYLDPGETLEFEAVVSGTTNRVVTWTATGGSISVSGDNTMTYAAPTVPGMYEVTARSVQDGSATYVATVVVRPAPPPADFNDDFENSSLANWTVGGRRQGTYVTEIVTRNNSRKAHLYHANFTEVTLHKDVAFGPNFRLNFEMETAVTSSAGGSSNFYARAGVWLYFMDASSAVLGWVGYQQSTSSHLSTTCASSTCRVTRLTSAGPNVYDFTASQLLDQITIDQSAIAFVRIEFSGYGSGWPFGLSGRVWFDDVQYRRDGW